jgi:hypothetical protein
VNGLPAKVSDRGSREPGGMDAARRRLLKLAIYAAPFMMTLGLPESSRAANQTHCPASCRCSGACGLN